MLFNFGDTQFTALLNLVPLLQLLFIALLFNKVGIEWWKGIIPIYNIYEISKLGKKENYFKWYVIISITFITFAILIDFLLVAFFAAINAQLISFYLFFIFIYLSIIIEAIIFILIQIFFTYKIYKGLSDSFEQSTVFAIGLTLLPVVFIGILALDDNKQYNPNNSSNNLNNSKSDLNKD